MSGLNTTGWIIYNGHLPGEKFLDFANWLHLAAKRQDIYTKIYKNNEVLVTLTSEKLDLLTIDNDPLPDFVIFTDKDIYLAKQFELMGIRVFNSAYAIETSDDKIATYQMLAKQNITIPKTIIAPKLFPVSQTLDITYLENVALTLGFPFIIKEAFGSFGEQVYLIHTMEEMKEKVISLQGKPFIFQAFIQSSYGRDVRLHVVGDEVVASMERNASNDFRANVSAGGTMKQYTPSKEEENIAIAATKAIDADIAGVDLLFGVNGEPIVCEVNSNAHIRNMYDCTNINVADCIITYIKEVMRNK